MAEQNTPPSDSQVGDFIDANDQAAVSAWAKKLDATPEQIQEAVTAVGKLAADVEMHLKGSRSTTNADREARADGTEAHD
jgi:hypothetical protein